MTVKFKKWGNSVGLLLPKSIIDKYQIDLDKEYDVVENKNGFTIKEKKIETTLDELLQGMSRNNRHEETIKNKTIITSFQTKK